MDKYPSVTQVLAPYQDYSHVPADRLAAAARRGTEVHRICASLALGLWVPEVPAECAPYVESFRRWFEAYVMKVVAAEIELVDPKLGFMGHPDLICRIKGDDEILTLTDLKTPVAESRSWRVQLAAYWHLSDQFAHDSLSLLEYSYPAIRRAMALQLSPEGGMPRVREYTGTRAHDFYIFRCALEAWRYFNG